MNKLFVFFNSHKVGVLYRDNELIYSFQYDENWLNYEHRFPLSLVLKLEKKVYGNKDTLSFFENLLPEGEVKNILEKNQNVHGVFDFLKEFGKDCAGAVVLSTDEFYKESVTSQKIIPIDENQIYKSLAEKKSIVELIAHKNPGYLSLAGAQDKFPVIYKNNKFYLPLNGAPTTHIVKMPIFRHNIKDSVYNEFFCMNLARKVGFSVPECTIHQGKIPLYVVSRYDRQKDIRGFITRLHQQDFCQAQGFTSEFKYEENGGPSIKNNFDLIVNNISAKKRMNSVSIFLDWVAFNLLIGNNDSHSKNISLLLLNNRIEIAPMYDLICTAIYPKLQKKFSFKIGEKTDFTQMSLKELNKVDQKLDFKLGTFQERFQNMHELITINKDSVIEEINEKYGEVKLVTRINKLIEDRARTFKNQKSLK